MAMGHGAGGSMRWAAVVAVLAARVAGAQMLDQDGLLVEASAVPERGTVRLAGSGGGRTSAGAGDEAGANVAGSVLWVPFHGLGGDVGAYYQAGSSGPSVRVRYQLLEQERAGINLALGGRYKSVAFQGEGDNQGEAEALVSVGRSFGRLDLVVNLVWGWELGAPGQDAEVKALAGWRFSDSLRAGIEARAQSEVHDEDGWRSPQLRSTDLRGGATVFVRVARPVTVQLLAGVAKPNTVTAAGFLALGALSVDL